MRVEHASATGILDFGQGKVLVLCPEPKLALTIDIAGLPKELSDLTRNWLGELREAVTRVGPNVEDAGYRQVASRQARGFRIIRDDRLLVLWVDATSAVPVQVECRDRDGTRIVLGDLDFSTPLDASRFSLTPPPGYLALMVNMDLKDIGEQDLVRLLDTFSQANGGKFPKSLETDDTIDLLLEPAGNEDETSFVQVMDTLNTAIRTYLFLAFARDTHYAGADIQRGQADTPIFWHRPNGSQMYRVIYGDLSVRDVARNDLPAAAPDARDPGQKVP